MEVRYGKDYNDYFDTKTYLTTKLSANPEDNEWDVFASRCYHEFWSKLPRKNLRVLDFGGGPKISDLISATPYVEEIIFAEYTEKNRQGKYKPTLHSREECSEFADLLF